MALQRHVQQCLGGQQPPRAASDQDPRQHRSAAHSTPVVIGAGLVTLRRRVHAQQDTYRSPWQSCSRKLPRHGTADHDDHEQIRPGWQRRRRGRSRTEKKCRTMGCTGSERRHRQRSPALPPPLSPPATRRQDSHMTVRANGWQAGAGALQAQASGWKSMQMTAQRANTS